MMMSELVRCIFGSGVQRQAEAAGMRRWCDEHCKDGFMRSCECAGKLKEQGIKTK